MARMLFATLIAALASWPGVVDAQITPYPVILTLSGPATAVSGQEITYTVHYRLTDPETVPGASIMFTIPEHTTYVSTYVVSGPEGSVLEPRNSRSGEWSVGSPEEPEGAVAFTVRINDDFVGMMTAAVRIRGTETFNPESTYSAETQVFAPGTLPETGTGGSATGDSPLMALLLLAFVGAALVSAGAATRYVGRCR